MGRPSWDEIENTLAPLFRHKEPRWDEVIASLVPFFSGKIRPDWDGFFMGVVESLRVRSSCDRGRTAALLVKDNRIIATGYAGSLPGFPHCDDEGHQMWKIIDDQGNESNHCFRTLHAEENLIIQAAKFGISVAGSTLVCMMTPCHQRCAPLIVGAEIVRVVAKRRYHADGPSIKMFEQAGIQLDILDDGVETYENQ